jgi:hypothetical protein
MSNTQNIFPPLHLSDLYILLWLVYLVLFPNQILRVYRLMISSQSSLFKILIIQINTTFFVN